MTVLQSDELAAVSTALSAYGELVTKLANGRWISLGALELHDSNGMSLGYLDSENDDVYFKTEKEELL